MSPKKNIESPVCDFILLKVTGNIIIIDLYMQYVLLINIDIAHMLMSTMNAGESIFGDILAINNDVIPITAAQ